MTDEEKARAWMAYSDYVAKKTNGTMCMYISEYRDSGTGMISRQSLPCSIQVLGLGEDFANWLYGDVGEARVNEAMDLLRKKVFSALHNSKDNVSRLEQIVSKWT